MTESKHGRGGHDLASLLPQIGEKLQEIQDLVVVLETWNTKGVFASARVAPPPVGQAFVARVRAIEDKLRSGATIHLTAEEAWVHYRMGSGAAVRVSIEQVMRGIDIVRNNRRENKIYTALWSVRGQTGQFPLRLRDITIEPTDYAIFGTTEVHFDGAMIVNLSGWTVRGDVWGTADRFDNNPGSRPFLVEGIVRAINFLEPRIGAAGYDIFIVGRKAVNLSGSWREVR
ncbi:MAG TPA: hypothetical protein VD713_05125 [Sphingomonadales bacterium]|nr:hypothetical protein [Sphingomonadales bacterium]